MVLVSVEVIAKLKTSRGPIVAAAEKKTDIIDGYTIKYHANGKTRWSKGKVEDGQPVGYWEWYRVDGTIKRSGHFRNGEPPFVSSFTESFILNVDSICSSIST